MKITKNDRKICKLVRMSVGSNIRNGSHRDLSPVLVSRSSEEKTHTHKSMFTSLWPKP